MRGVKVLTSKVKQVGEINKVNHSHRSVRILDQIQYASDPLLFDL